MNIPDLQELVCTWPVGCEATLFYVKVSDAERLLNEIKRLQAERDEDRIASCIKACDGISNERLARMDLKDAIECLDNSGGNIDCNDYCGVAHALSRPKEQST